MITAELRRAVGAAVPCSLEISWEAIYMCSYGIRNIWYEKQSKGALKFISSMHINFVGDWSIAIETDYIVGCAVSVTLYQLTVVLVQALSPVHALESIGVLVFKVFVDASN